MLLLIAALTVAGGVAYWMWQSTPDYWRAHQRAYENADPDTLTRMAESAEQRTLSDLSRTRGVALEWQANTRTLELTYEQINAWLSQRLEPWLANQGASMPEAIRAPMLTERDGRLVLAFRAETPELNQVVSIFFDIELTDDGRARLHIRRILGGELPMPVDTILQRVAQQASQGSERRHSQAVRTLRRVLDGQSFTPIIPIDRQRRGRLIDLAVEDDRLLLTVRVEKRPRANR